MTVKSCEKLEKSRVALTIETSAEEFEAAVNKTYPASAWVRPPVRSSRRCTAPRSFMRKP